MAEPCRVVFYWEQGGIGLDSPRVNPYGGLLARGLASHNVLLEPGWTFDQEWVRAQHGRVQVVHFNWLHRFYDGPDPEERRRRFREFTAALVLARRLGMRIVWTMHNLYPHETHDTRIDRRMRRLVCALAHAVIAHCPHAATLLVQHFGRRDGVYVIPHGHFIDIYPNTASREEARRRLDIPNDAYVYLFFGNIRAYKGVERLLEEFAAQPGEHLRLLIAGRVHPNYHGSLGRSTDSVPDARVLLYAGQVEIEQMQVYFNAANSVVLPFVDTLSSGSAITALGFGRPIVVPAVGCLPELVDGRLCGVVYNSSAPDGLRRALETARTMDGEAASADAMARARELDWDVIGQQALSAYGLEPGGLWRSGDAV